MRSRGSLDSILYLGSLHVQPLDKAWFMCTSKTNPKRQRRVMVFPCPCAATFIHRNLSDFRYNRIWSGRAAGVAVTEDGRGHIAYNDICSMEWAGIDIRNGADPVVSHNVIRKGQADGIVIGEGGKSILYDNDIQGILTSLYFFCYASHMTKSVGCWSRVCLRGVKFFGICAPALIVCLLHSLEHRIGFVTTRILYL